MWKLNLFALAATLSLVFIPLAPGHQGHASGAAVQAAWGKEQIDLAEARLVSAQRSATSLDVKQHVGVARTWLKGFLFRARSAGVHARDVLAWSDHNLGQERQLREAIGSTESAVAAARRALAEATVAWNARSRVVAKARAQIALALARVAQDDWNRAHALYVRASRPALTVGFSLRLLKPSGAQPFPLVSVYEQGGVDRLDIIADQLDQNARYTTFLTESGDPPYGANVFIGDFTTDGMGRAAVSFQVNFFDAVAVRDGVPIHLHHIVLFYGSSQADDLFAPGASATAYDADGDAGVATAVGAVPRVALSHGGVRS